MVTTLSNVKYFGFKSRIIMIISDFIPELLGSVKTTELTEQTEELIDAHQLRFPGLVFFNFPRQLHYYF